ncbi:MAG: M24 family metallopeptidase [bacterium]
MAGEDLPKILDKENLDALLFLSLENIRYLCGFTGSEGVLLVTKQERYFLSDFRYETQAQKELRGAIFKRYRQKIEGLAKLLKNLRVKRLGFEARAMNYEDFSLLREKLPRLSLKPLVKEISRLRALKSPEEVAKIRQAVQIATASFQSILPKLKNGRKEKSIAALMEMQIIRRGGQKSAFPTIVASGPRAALPHGVASEKVLKKGEMVVIDFGACWDGYNSDETQTVILGKPSKRLREIYDLVWRAQEKALRIIRPGVSLKKIDQAARETISRAGYGKFFGHGTGHGLGLAVHEEPRISPRATGVAEEGMVFTVEPGIYIPGWGGVRLEDLILVTSRGWEKLTFLPKEIEENIIF